MDLQQSADELSRTHPIVYQVVGLLALFVLGWIADWIATRWMLRIARAAVGRSEAHWDDALLNSRFFHRVANLFPVLFVYFGAEIVAIHGSVEVVVQRIALASATFIAARSIACSKRSASGFLVPRRPLPTMTWAGMSRQ